MKKLIMFFAGIALLLLTFATLYVAAGIFDAGDARNTDAYFFQVNGQSGMRLGVPASTRDLGPIKMRDMLIKKYVYEYLYALPDEADIKRRMTACSSRHPMAPCSTLARMSSDSVFSAWLDSEAPFIEQLSAKRALRMVRVLDPIVKPDGSDYWIAQYELKTWYTPNDLTAMPETTRGEMYLVISTNDDYNELRDTIDVGQALKNGIDAATLFKFKVTRVEVQ